MQIIHSLVEYDRAKATHESPRIPLPEERPIIET